MADLPNPWLSNPEVHVMASGPAGGLLSSLPSGESDPAVMLDCPPADPLQDLIHEIFVGHAKLHEDFPRGFDPVQFYTDIIEMPLVLRRARG